MSRIRFSGTDLGFGQVSYFLIRSPIVLRVYNPFVSHMSHQILGTPILKQKGEGISLLLFNKCRFSVFSSKKS